MQRKFVAIAAVALLFVAADAKTPQSNLSSDQIGQSVIIVGDLGVPVGQEVTIGGYKKRNGPLQDTFWVETIDGKPRPGGAWSIQVDGIAKWPDNTKATLRGNEVGTLKFLHLEETNFGPDDKRWKGPYQKLFLRFQVAEIVAPKGLEIDTGK